MADLLFNSYDLSAVLASHMQKISKKIGSLEENRLLNSSHSDLCEYFMEEYAVDPPKIDEDRIQVDYGDAEVDVSQRFEYGVFDRSVPFYVTGTRITFYVPFDGDANLLSCRPSTFSLNPPRGKVTENELIFIYERTRSDASGIAEEFQRDLGNLKRFLSWIEDDINEFNSSFESEIGELISTRRKKVLEDRGIVENLGFPLRRSSEVPTTYATPKVKRRMKPQLSASTEPYKPEPALNLDDYEHILSVISDMVLVMERSPQAFRGMGEEHLRQHFLVQLNGHYEGQATGETFNYEGRTDILVRDSGKTIFIAECKFWTGSSGLKDAIDQLLGYASWRDTKTAILIFNRDRNLSTVLDKVPDAVKSHPNFKRELSPRTLKQDFDTF